MNQPPLNPDAVTLINACKELYESKNPGRIWEELPNDAKDFKIKKMRKQVSAYLAALPVEYAGLHKHAGLDTKDEEDVEFMSEEHLRETFADYPYCTLMYRPSTQ